MKFAAKDVAKRLIPLVNRGTERLGVRLQPVHYYSEVPDRRALRLTRREWARPITLTGVHWDLDEQIGWLRGVCAPYAAEVAGLREWRELGKDRGPGYGPTESTVLHCFVRSTRPERIIEIGSGVSTVISRRAADRNVAEGLADSAITCIEPFPRQALLDFPGVRVDRRRAQVVEEAAFAELCAGDMLFIDSTHAVRTGSELARVYLEVIPNLAPGVVLHIHDVMLPYLFSPDVLDSPFDWQETTLLAALLTRNQSLKVLACESALHHDRQEELRAILPDYRPVALRDGLFAGYGRTDENHQFPSSIWLATV